VLERDALVVQPEGIKEEIDKMNEDKPTEEAGKNDAASGLNERIFMPDFGSTVFASARLVRREKRDYVENKRTNRKEPVIRKVWEEKPLGKSCVFLGTRTLQNGRREYDGDYGYYFRPDDYFKAALVSPGPNENPVYVPISALQAIREEAGPQG